MRWLADIVGLLFPEALLKGTAWESVWDKEQRVLFIRIATFFYPAASIVYIGHFVFYDLVLKLQPIESWLAFRLGAATICLITLAFYRSSFVKIRWYKIPAFLTLALLCYSQARVTVNHDVTFIFCFVFVLIAIFVLRSSALNSFLFAALILGIQAPSLIEAGVGVPMVVSGSLVTLLTCVVTRGAYASEIRNFLLTNERDQSKQQMIDLAKEFSDRLRSFIPKVIANRLQTAVDHQGMSVLEASVSVLRPQTMEISCLFSDIRGFTQGSKNLDTFIENSVLPEVKACSDAIEDYEGIPRKIGDLVFAYFDDHDMPLNALRSLLAGITISQKNKDMNATVSIEAIQRYILISSGEAIVGNVGGLNSSVEITALGSTVNFLARLDDATKKGSLARLLSPGDILLCNRSVTLLQALDLELQFDWIDFSELQIEIRDFPEVDGVYLLKPNNSILTSLVKTYRSLLKQQDETRYTMFAS